MKIFRFDPSRDRNPHYETFEVPYDKGDRILDVLLRIREDLGRDLAFRWACKNRICGSCSVSVNGEPKLLCWDEAKPEMTLEPLSNFPVIKDLVVDRSKYDAIIQKLNPYLEPKELKAITGKITPETLYNLKPDDTELTGRFQECIECLLCVSTCTVTNDSRTVFPGPAALARLAQYSFDPRDNMQRVKIAFEDHIYDCLGCFSCENVCPVNIPIVTGINGIKKLAKTATNKEEKYLREMVEGYF
jgi:succinate dehydrogenase/fumarate reductase iron-sulfur protein